MSLAKRCEQGHGEWPEGRSAPNNFNGTAATAVTAAAASLTGEKGV
jgi:hypothetical protein